MFNPIRRPVSACAGMALIASLALAGAAQAESIQKQCSEKYQAAKAANSLNGETWNQFYKQCATDLKGGAAPAATAPSAAPAQQPVATAAPPAEHKRKKAESTAAAPAAPSGPAVFPSAVDPKYSSLSAGKARMKTCLDQYHANKATNSNGGLRWIEKGDGYYSECNKKLKGA